MNIYMLKAKINNATVTHSELYYEGSITLDRNILEEAGILTGEWVDVLNLNNGARLQTYTIEAPANSGNVILNGPAARLGYVGDKLIILARCVIDENEAATFHPRIIKLDENNRPIQQSFNS